MLLPSLSKIYQIVNELKELESELSYMDSAWNGNDECERALSDPGLQYEVEMQIDAKKKELGMLFIGETSCK